MKQNNSSLHHSSGTLLHYAQRGFTIVELLIVVIIIAILAAITIVAYNGIQTRAKNSAAIATANNLARKMHAFYTVNGSFPTGADAATVTGATMLAKYPESTLPSSGINFHKTATPMNATTGTNTVKVEICSGVGIRITPWDYTTGADSLTPLTLGTMTACSLLTS